MLCSHQFPVLVAAINNVTSPFYFVPLWPKSYHGTRPQNIFMHHLVRHRTFRTLSKTLLYNIHDNEYITVTFDTQDGDVSEVVPDDNQQQQQQEEEGQDAPEKLTLDKIATVKERKDTLIKAKRAHPPLEKKSSSKLKIPDVFQSPQTSPLSKQI